MKPNFFNPKLIKMNTSKYIIPVLLFSSLLSMAQTVDQNVTVEREYKPVIQDAGKITSLPAIVEPVTEKTKANYTEINLPMLVGQNIQNLSAAELEIAKRKQGNSAFVRLGAGNYLNNMLDFALPVLKKPDMRLDLNANHLATFGDKAHSTTEANVLFDKNFNNSNFYTGVGVGYEYFKYYGNYFDFYGQTSDLNGFKTGGQAYYNELNLVRVNRTPQTYTLNQITNSNDFDVFWRFNAFVGLQSLPNADGLRYVGEVKFKSFNSQHGLKENIIESKANFNTNYGRNRLGIDVKMQNMMYTSNMVNPIFNAWDAYSVFEMNPFYSFERKNWNLRFGVKSSFSFVHGRPFNPSPDIFAEWKAIPKWLAIYGGVGGGYQVNTLDRMFKENRYLFSDLRVKDTYIPVSPFIGIKVKPAYNILIDAYLKYDYIDNEYFFVNKDYQYSPLSTTSLASRTESVIYSNRFNAVYSKAAHTELGVRANYNIRNLINIQWKGAYNHWKVYDIPTAWNKPKFESDLAADVRLTRNLNLTTNVFFESERFAKIGSMDFRMKPKLDVNLGASYSYLNWLTIFGKVNNLTNSKYEEYYGYEVQGINFMVGAAFSF